MQTSKGYMNDNKYISHNFLIESYEEALNSSRGVSTS